MCGRLARDVWVRLLPPPTPKSLPPPLGHRGLGPGERNAPGLKPQVHGRVRPSQVLVQSIGSTTLCLDRIHSQIKSLTFSEGLKTEIRIFVSGTNVLTTRDFIAAICNHTRPKSTTTFLRGSYDIELKFQPL